MFELLPDESGDGSVSSGLQHIQQGLNNAVLRLQVGQCCEKFPGHLYQKMHNTSWLPA